MNNIKKARVVKGMGQKEVAAALNVAQPTISAWESGSKAPSNKNLVMLSELLEVSVDYLLGASDTPTPSTKEKPPTYWELFEQEFIKMFGRNPTDSDIDKALLHLRVDVEFQKKNTD